jgi:hypothetical protein
MSTYDPFDQGKSVGTAKSSIWTLDMALDLTNALQPYLKKYGYQATLWGAILTGESRPACDMLILPSSVLDQTNPIPVITYLAKTFGAAVDLRLPPKSLYKHGLGFTCDGLGLNVYVG